MLPAGQLSRSFSGAYCGSGSRALLVAEMTGKYTACAAASLAAWACGAAVRHAPHWLPAALGRGALAASAAVALRLAARLSLHAALANGMLAGLGGAPGGLEPLHQWEGSRAGKAWRVRHWGRAQCPLQPRVHSHPADTQGARARVPARGPSSCARRSDGRTRTLLASPLGLRPGAALPAPAAQPLAVRCGPAERCRYPFRGAHHSRVFGLQSRRAATRSSTRARATAAVRVPCRLLGARLEPHAVRSAQRPAV